MGGRVVNEVQVPALAGRARWLPTHQSSAGWMRVEGYCGQDSANTRTATIPAIWILQPRISLPVCRVRGAAPSAKERPLVGCSTGPHGAPATIIDPSCKCQRVIAPKGTGRCHVLFTLGARLGCRLDCCPPTPTT